MTFTNDDIDKLAQLSRLKITDGERENLLFDLNNIFKMIAIMQEVDTKNIEPITHSHIVPQRLREDIAIKIDNKDEYLKIAPLTDEGFYIVPKIIEEFK